MIPSEFVNRILDGENKIRIWRDFRGLKARQLAEQADISTAYLSEIESGNKDGSISALKRIAVALKVDLDDLV